MVVVVRGVPLPALVPRMNTEDREGHRRESVRRARVSRKPLPLPEAPPPPRRDVVFGMCAVDSKGRISDTRAMATLGWEAGLRVSFTVAHKVIVINADDAGGQGVCGRHCLRLPSSMRRAVGIGVKERVLLAAIPDPGLLVVHPLVQLDRWSAAVHTAVLGGER
ncbi:hypothetical protein [Actinoplanes flavus]|uniref:Uncharacterized protein n=1 Tax=Actinoplanes flavus TaxID=2820290 RepID=A0ABS3UCQ2_9ACTN|nr:hypothetical protein [Actinoplanes flavus]MBO3736558.1 hypothetical protein [Actinoplanes flavus]